MGTSDVLKVFKIARAVGECNLKNFQNITSDHKSRNARAVHFDFLFIIFSTKLLHNATLQALGAQYLQHFSMVSKMQGRSVHFSRSTQNVHEAPKARVAEGSGGVPPPPLPKEIFTF